MESGGLDCQAQELRSHFGSSKPWWRSGDGGIWILWSQCGVGLRHRGSWEAGQQATAAALLRRGLYRDSRETDRQEEGWYSGEVPSQAAAVLVYDKREAGRSQGNAGRTQHRSFF